MHLNIDLVHLDSSSPVSLPSPPKKFRPISRGFVESLVVTFQKKEEGIGRRKKEGRRLGGERKDIQNNNNNNGTHQA